VPLVATRVDVLPPPSAQPCYTCATGTSWRSCEFEKHCGFCCRFECARVRCKHAYLGYNAPPEVAHGLCRIAHCARHRCECAALELCQRPPLWYLSCAGAAILTLWRKGLQNKLVPGPLARSLCRFVPLESPCCRLRRRNPAHGQRGQARAHVSLRSTAGSAADLRARGSGASMPISGTKPPVSTRIACAERHGVHGTVASV
jgi:hypothetical protein